MFGGYCNTCWHGVVRTDDDGINEYIYCFELEKEVSFYGSCNHWEIDPHIKARETADYKDNSRSGGSSCFLTSACVDFYGKSDDCTELTKLRWFRDNHMKNTEDGQVLVEEYYKVGPRIVEAIDASENRASYYEDIYRIVEKCVRLIDAGEFKKTLDEYVAMVNDLKKRLNID